MGKHIDNERITVSLGIVEEVQHNINGFVKYKIAYVDYQGRSYTTWSNWMRDDQYKIGDSIPVKNVSIPSFGLLNIPLAINNNPQHHEEIYISATVIASIGAMLIGYNIGKNKK